MTWIDIEYKENLIISFDKIWKDRKKQTNYCQTSLKRTLNIQGAEPELSPLYYSRGGQLRFRAL